MRVHKAELKDYVAVVKTAKEFRKDVGLPEESEDMPLWIKRLTDESRKYWLLLHGRKTAGMVWGFVSEDQAFVIEGKFLRRGFRGKLRFTKELRKTCLQITEGFDKIRAILPPNQKPKGKQRVLGTLVELEG